MRLSRFLVLVLALSALAIAPLAADVIRYVTRSPDLIFNTSPRDLPLNDNGATEITFKNTGGGGKKFVAITFSAECAVQGSEFAWLGIDIVVDDVVVAPSAGDDAFCSGNGTDTGRDGWLTASRTVAVKLGSGEHTVKVVAELVGSAEGWIGDSSLTIID